RLRRAEHALVGGGDRDHDDVVLVLPPAALAFPLEHTDHGEGHGAHPHHAADGIGVAEDILGNRLAAQHDLARALLLLSGEGGAGHGRPLPGALVVGGGALDRGGPVHVPVHHLVAAAHRRRRRVHGGNLGGDGGGIALGDGGPRSVTKPHAGGGHAAGQDD